jgi:hypothetical protein
MRQGHRELHVIKVIMWRNYSTKTRYFPCSDILSTELTALAYRFKKVPVPEKRFTELGSFACKGRIIADYCLHSYRMNIPRLLENVSRNARLNTWQQHTDAPPHFVYKSHRMWISSVEVYMPDHPVRQTWYPFFVLVGVSASRRTWGRPTRRNHSHRVNSRGVSRTALFPWQHAWNVLGSNTCVLIRAWLPEPIQEVV